MGKRGVEVVVFLLLAVGCMLGRDKESVSLDGVTLPDDAHLIFFSPQLDWVTYERQNALWLAPLPNVEDKVKIMRDYTFRVWAMHTYWMPDGTGFLMLSYEDAENDSLGTATWWLTKVNNLDEQIPLCTLSGVERVISWSPDSTAFAAIDRGGGVSIVRTDGSGCEKLPDLGLLFPSSVAVSWSPDGQKITYASCLPANLEACETRIMDLRTYETTPVYACAGNPIWFSDGERIGFLNAGEGAIVIVWTDGSGLVDKLELPDRCSIADEVWSSDGSHLALELRRIGPDSSPVGIGVLDSNSLTLSILEAPDFYRLEGWTPDESAVVVSRYEGSNLVLREVSVAP